TITVPGAEPVYVSAEDKRVHLSGLIARCDTAADTLRASADRVTRSGPEGMTLTLEGNASLMLVRKGKKADLVAERISVNLTTNRVESELPGCTPPPKTTSPMVTPCPLSPAPSPAPPTGLYQSTGQ